GRVTPVELATGEALRALEQRIDALVRAPGDLEAGAALGRALLPAALRPAPGVPLYIAADGPLLRLPFALLRVDGGPAGGPAGGAPDRYLVELHPLVHVPSLGALAAIEEHARPPAGP